MAFYVAKQQIQGERPTQEDSLLVFPCTWPEIGEGYFLAVCDGMGGEEGGELASSQAVGAMERFAQENAGKKEASSFLTEALQAAHQTLVENKQQWLLPQEAGTTAVTALILAGQAWVAWVGDSRAYRYGPSGSIKQLTQDHSLVQELVEAGKLAPEAARLHPLRHVITRALGSEQFKCESSIREIRLSAGDLLLLCSDGVTDVLDAEVLQEFFSQHSTSDVQAMADALLEKVKQAGTGRKLDNASVIIARWE